VLDPAALRRAAQGIAGIYHLAAIPSVARSIEAPLEVHAAGATGTLQVLEIARAQQLRVVYAGSSSAYGGAADDEDRPRDEQMREAPLSPYAAAKLAGELYCRVFSHVHGIPTVVTRFFNVYGPRQPADSPYSGVVAAFCRALCDGRAPRVDGDGRQSRDFTYVEDVVAGMRLAMTAPLQGHHTINLATGESHTILDLLATLSGIAGREVSPVFAPARPGDVRHSRGSIARARALLGFAPKFTLAQGLRPTFDSYRKPTTP
jgi:UDP-glucose 4-epimerase